MEQTKEILKPMVSQQWLVKEDANDNKKEIRKDKKSEKGEQNRRHSYQLQEMKTMKENITTRKSQEAT